MFKTDGIQAHEQRLEELSIVEYRVITRLRNTNKRRCQLMIYRELDVNTVLFRRMGYVDR